MLAARLEKISCERPLRVNIVARVQKNAQKFEIFFNFFSLAGSLGLFGDDWWTYRLFTVDGLTNFEKKKYKKFI